MEIFLWILVTVGIYAFNAWQKIKKEQIEQMPSQMVSPYQAPEKPKPVVAEETPKPLVKEKPKPKKPSITYANVLQEYGHNRLKHRVQLTKESIERSPKLVSSLEKPVRTPKPDLEDGYKFSKIEKADAKTMIDWKNKDQAEAYKKVLEEQSKFLAFLKNPESLKHAFIVSEIMKRPEW